MEIFNLDMVWQIILYLFAVIGMLNTAKSFYKNYLKREKPVLEIDITESFKNLDENIEINRYIKIINNSDKIAFRVHLYILNTDGGKISMSYDNLKPADAPIIHHTKNSSPRKTFNIKDHKNFITILEYRDSKGKIYYTRRVGINQTNWVGSTKRPKEINYFFAHVRKIKKQKSLIKG